ncbi:MAG: tetratricopeptide repeat protein, partial [Phycisphaeraceae bacterium]|nr:tetratricopeptide repeat protein [Phycisphaeraceae bacterium]
EAIETTDELYLTGEHLEQYRHPTRYPEAYWEEAIRRDPGDARSRIALGRKALDRGEFATAADHLQVAIDRLTARHPNPETGEAHYFLGVTRQYEGQPDAARNALAKATWSFAWQAAAHYRLATLATADNNPATAHDHLDRALARNQDFNQARVLRAILWRRSGRADLARQALEDLLATDPLDHWAVTEQAILAGDPPVSPPRATTPRPPSTSPLTTPRSARLKRPSPFSAPTTTGRPTTCRCPIRSSARS